jgi:hypothetical protein
MVYTFIWALFITSLQTTHEWVVSRQVKIKKAAELTTMVNYESGTQ